MAIGFILFVILTTFLVLLIVSFWLAKGRVMPSKTFLVIWIIIWLAFLVSAWGLAFFNLFNMRIHY